MFKSALFTVSLFTLSASAFAWPGTRSVSCQSEPGAKQKVSLVISITGTPTPDMPAEVDLAIDGMSVKLDDPERTSISIIEEPADKVITASYRERDEKHETLLQIWAKPATIKGGLDKQNCVETYRFRAGVNAYMGTWSLDKPEDNKDATASGTLNCTYRQTFGSAGC